MDWKGREQSQNVEDRRGSSGGGGGGGRTPGILGIIVVLIGAYYGIDLSGLVGTPSMGTGSTQTSQLKPQEEAELNELARVVLADTEKAWGSYFKQHGQNYTPTTLVLYNGGTSTACGMGQSAMGPFYCSGDKKVYLDLDFYRDMQTKLNSASDAAFAYVIAHEVGHHVQNLLGILPKVHRMQQQVGKKEANALSVKLELQADCYAGIWGHYAVNNNIFKPEDIPKAMLATACRKMGRAMLFPTALHTARPNSAWHGSNAVWTAATSINATLSAID